MNYIRYVLPIVLTLISFTTDVYVAWILLTVAWGIIGYNIGRDTR